MGKYDSNEKGNKRDFDVKLQSERDQLKTASKDKRTQTSKPSSQYNPRSTSKSQSEDRDIRKPSDDEQRTPSSRKS